MSPDEFKAAVEAVLTTSGHRFYAPTGYDPEAAHGDTDQLMEEVLIKLGYGEGVALIRESQRWYS